MKEGTEIKVKIMQYSCNIIVKVLIINMRNFLLDKIIQYKTFYVLKNMLILLKNNKCPAVKVCPAGSLSQEGFNAHKINYDKCIKCGKCSNFCPKKALVLEEID